jgi:hypothetical protein
LSYSGNVSIVLTWNFNSTKEIEGENYSLKISSALGNRGRMVRQRFRKMRWRKTIAITLTRQIPF